MTAVTLFDLVTSDPAAESHSTGRHQFATNFAAKMVAEALEDFERLREYERQCIEATDVDQPLPAQVRRLIWQMFGEWAENADTVYSRATRLTDARSNPVLRLDELSLSIARVQARLQVTPDQIERAIEDIKQGRVIPGEELRNELRLRRGA